MEKELPDKCEKCGKHTDTLGEDFEDDNEDGVNGKYLCGDCYPFDEDDHSHIGTFEQLITLALEKEAIKCGKCGKEFYRKNSPSEVVCYECYTDELPELGGE